MNEFNISIDQIIEVFNKYRKKVHHVMYLTEVYSIIIYSDSISKSEAMDITNDLLELDMSYTLEHFSTLGSTSTLVIKR